MPSDAVRVLIIGAAAVSLWRPVNGILLLAVLAPVGALAGGQSSSPLQLADALALGFLAGWVVRRPPRRRGPAFPQAAVIAIWALGLAALLQIRAHVWTAGHVLEGAAIAFAAVELLRSRPGLATRLPAAAAAGLLAAAATTWAIGHSAFAPSSAVFAMMACASAGLAMRGNVTGSRAVSSRTRLSWTLASCAMVAAVFRLAQPAGHEPFARLVERTGIIGGLLLLVIVASVLWHAFQGIAARPRDARLLGCTLGLFAYLAIGVSRGGTGADGHVTFWLMLGLTAGLAGSNLLRETASPRDVAASPDAPCG